MSNSIIDRLQKRRHRAVKLDGTDDTVYLRPLTGKELRAVLTLPEMEQDGAYLALALCDDAGNAVCPWVPSESIQEYANRAWNEFASEIPVTTRVELLAELNKLQRPPSQKALEKN